MWSSQKCSEPVVTFNVPVADRTQQCNVTKSIFKCDFCEGSVVENVMTYPSNQNHVKSKAPLVGIMLKLQIMKIVLWNMKFWPTEFLKKIFWYTDMSLFNVVLKVPSDKFSIWFYSYNCARV